MSEVEETLHRMQTHKNVQGIIILNGEGMVIRSTFVSEKTDYGTITLIGRQWIGKADSTVGGKSKKCDTGHRHREWV